MLGMKRNQKRSILYVNIFLISNLIVILECIKGKHLELIRPKDALSKLFDRFFNNLSSFSLMVKSLITLHRALQEEDIS